MRTAIIAVTSIVSLTACWDLVEPDVARLGDADGGVEAACPLDQLSCDGSCVSPETDDLHCGGCGVRCAWGAECVGAACTCSPGFSDVAGDCLDLASDPDNCGAAGIRCPSGLCTSGQCAPGCPAWQIECDGTCVDATVDEEHCGQCFHSCGVDEICFRAECRAIELGC